MRVVLASRNGGKLRELRALLPEWELEPAWLADGWFKAQRFGWDEPFAHTITGETLTLRDEIEEMLRLALPWAAELGERATLLQFSSAFCAPCRATRRILHEVAEADDGVRHLEVDTEHHLDLVRRLGIQRTPTTLVLDGDGVEVTRAAGAPTKAQVRGVLDALAAR